MRQVNGQWRALQPWVPPAWSLRDMVDQWMDLGFIVEQDDQFVETWRLVSDQPVG
jgi:hypothetical protein